jgi:hypothetical protein
MEKISTIDRNLASRATLAWSNVEAARALWRSVPAAFNGAVTEGGTIRRPQNERQRNENPRRTRIHHDVDGTLLKVGPRAVPAANGMIELPAPHTAAITKPANLAKAE